MTPQEIAVRAAEAVRALNHATRPGVAQSDDELDVVGIYDLLGELALMVSRLPQLLGQIETLLDALVEADQVLIVVGPDVGDPAAVAAICGHWLAVGAGSAHELAHRVDQAHQILAHAAATDTVTDSTGYRPPSS